jgi:hypothetical protein
VQANAIKAILSDAEAMAVDESSVKDAPHPHDIQLLSKVRTQLSPSLRLFLAQHNFGTPPSDLRNGGYEEDWQAHGSAQLCADAFELAN